MRLYNTLSRTIEEFEPLAGPQKGAPVGLYACGFTVYDYTHLGHLRKYTMDDVLIRLLRHEGYQVKFVQNVTDVGHLTSDADTGEDKLEKGAKKYGESVWDIAHRFEAYFFDSMDQMGNLRPDVSCRATEHIKQQIALVETLERKGYTYVIEGDGVYFDTSKISDYGQLAGLTPAKIKQLKAGARVELIEGKRNVTDFALWKFKRPGENRAMVWESKWAKRGFPGWHIECSAMSMEYLGEQFDIHTGGIDHIPVHHPDEIAQSEAATGKRPFVKYWVHHNYLRVDGAKMSKSLGNFYTIDDIKTKGFSPMALRLLFLTSHYRSEINFTWESLAGAQKAYEKLSKQVVSWEVGKANSAVTPQSDVQLSKEAQELNTRFWLALRDDLNTPQAMAIVWEMVGSNLGNADKQQLWMDWNQVLGLKVDHTISTQSAQIEGDTLDVSTLPPEVQALIAEREQARREKDWKRADEIRVELVKMGYELIDGKDGIVIKKS